MTRPRLLEDARRLSSTLCPTGRPRAGRKARYDGESARAQVAYLRRTGARSVPRARPQHYISLTLAALRKFAARTRVTRLVRITDSMSIALAHILGEWQRVLLAKRSLMVWNSIIAAPGIV